MSAKKRLTTSAAAAAACMLLAQTAPANAAQTVQNPAGLRGGIVADGTGRGGGGDDSPSPAGSDGAAVEPGAGGPSPSDAGGSPTPSGDSFDLTVMATTDVHGHAYNWDYFRDQPYPQGRVRKLGMARAATIIENARKSKPKGSVLVVDNGDAIQGTPLTYVAAKRPQLLQGRTHPMAEAFNDVGYDAQALGNHEFNYGLDVLRNYGAQLKAPLLGANVVKAGTETPAFTPYTLIDRTIGGKRVKIGVVGLVTPGVRVWDRAVVDGKLEFRDPVVTAQKYVPQMKARGADVVVALVHSGLDAEGVAWNPALLQENVAGSVASKVNDVDVVVGGHSHVDIPSKVFRAPDGDPVLFTQPTYWAQSVSQVTLPLKANENGRGYKVSWPRTDTQIGALAQAKYADQVADSPTFAANKKLKADHEATVAYVNTVVAQSKERLTSATSHYEDTPILDFVGRVMADNVRRGLKGTKYEGLPVVAQTSPFSRTAVFPKGNVTIKDIAGLYVFDNTLGGVLVTGRELKDYLEHSARYFVQVPEGSTFDPSKVNAKYDGATRGIPDYNYDALTGLRYRIDVSKPVGSRIVGLSYPDGRPLGDGDKLILAVNNYRQNGGGGFPHMGGNARVVYDEQQEIRQLLIDYAQNAKTIDPAVFFERNWEVVTSSSAASAPSASARPSGGAPSASAAPSRPAPPGSADPSDAAPPGSPVPSASGAAPSASNGASSGSEAPSGSGASPNAHGARGAGDSDGRQEARNPRRSPDPVADRRRTFNQKLAATGLDARALAFAGLLAAAAGWVAIRRRQASLRRRP